MKSLFSENDIVLPEWLGNLLEKVDRDTVQELLAEHEEYQTFCAKRKELMNQYPVIETLLEDIGEVRISEQEHQAVDLARMKARRWTTVLATACLNLILGGVIIFNPFSTAMTLLRFVGIGLLYSGISDIVSTLYISRETKNYRDFE